MAPKFPSRSTEDDEAVVRGRTTTKRVYVNEEYLRGKVREWLQMKQPRSAVYWAEKLVALRAGGGEGGSWEKKRTKGNGNCEEDVYLYAQALEENGECRAALAVLEKYKVVDTTKIKFRLLAARCLEATGEAQRAVELLEKFLEVEVNAKLTERSAARHADEAMQEVDDDGNRTAALLACCSLVLARSYDALDSKKLALKWYSHAIRLDRYCYEAVERIADNYMVSSDKLYEIVGCSNEHERRMSVNTMVTNTNATGSEDAAAGGGGGTMGTAAPMSISNQTNTSSGGGGGMDHDSNNFTSSNTANGGSGDDYVSLLMRCKISAQDAAVGLSSLLADIDSVVPAPPHVSGQSVGNGDGGDITTTTQKGSLSTSADVIACRAHWLYSRGMYADCYALTSATLSPPIGGGTTGFGGGGGGGDRASEASFAAMTTMVTASEPGPSGLGSSTSPILLLHIGCLSELGYRNELFLLAHRLVEENASSPLSWYAVGCYYMCIGSYNSARRYFSKSTAVDTRFIPSWMGFAHSFAAQDESDQAMAAYRTAARLFPGSHAPVLAMGVEYGRTGNYLLAEQSLMQALSIMPGDPAVYNELAVVKFRSREYDSAVYWMTECLRRLPEPLGVAWVSVANNMGHIQRKMGNYSHAIFYYERALRLTPKDPHVLASLGFTHHLIGGKSIDVAIEYYHKALALTPHDNFITEMLNSALTDACMLTPVI